MANEDMNVQQLEDAAKAEAAKAKEAAEEAAKAETAAAAEKAAKKAAAAAEKASKLIEQLEAKKAEEAVTAEVPVAHNVPVVDPEKEEAERKRAHAMELVPVFLFKDDDRYKDDVPVFVNGHRVLIKRGEEVMVPRYIAEVLNNSMKQDAQTDALMRRLGEEYEHNTEVKTKPFNG